MVQTSYSLDHAVGEWRGVRRPSGDDGDIDGDTGDGACGSYEAETAVA